MSKLGAVPSDLSIKSLFREESLSYKSIFSRLFQRVPGGGVRGIIDSLATKFETSIDAPLQCVCESALFGAIASYKSLIMIYYKVTLYLAKFVRLRPEPCCVCRFLLRKQRK